MKKVLLSLMVGMLPSYFLTQIILGFFPAETFQGINSWLPYVVCGEFVFFFGVIMYTYLGINRILQNSLEGVKSAEKDTIVDSLQSIEYDGKQFIYEIFETNIRHGENKTGKQAREFINENEILSSFTHISILNKAPAILTSFGLGCTFLAILLGLKGIHVSVDQPVQGLDVLINSLSSKFLTSLVALACAILLNFYNSWYLSSVHAAFLTIKNKIDSLFQMESIGKIISENLTVDLDLKELRSGLAAACRETADAIDEQLNSFKKLISSGELEKQITAGNNMIEALSKQITQLQLNTQQSAKFLETISNANTQLGDFSTKMGNVASVATTLEKISTSLQQDNEQLAANYNTVMKELKDITESFGEVCVNMRNNLQNNYAEAIETAVVKGLETPLQKITDSLQQAASIVQKPKAVSPAEPNPIQQPATAPSQRLAPQPPVPPVQSVPKKTEQPAVSTPAEQKVNMPPSSTNEGFEELKPSASHSTDDEKPKKGFWGF